MKIALALCLVTGVSAFQAPTAARIGTTTVSARSKAMPFLEAPDALDGSYPGDVGFDPVGFTKLDFDMSPSRGLPMVYWMREAELKHGRICMIAIVGWISVDLGFHFPSAKYECISSLSAHIAMVAEGNMAFLLLVIGVLEVLSAVALEQAADGSGRAAGDYALDHLKLANRDMLEKEITHCRLAMLAFSGLCTQAALFEKGFPYY